MHDATFVWTAAHPGQVARRDQVVAGAGGQLSEEPAVYFRAAARRPNAEHPGSAGGGRVFATQDRPAGTGIPNSGEQQTHSVSLLLSTGLSELRGQVLAVAHSIPYRGAKSIMGETTC